jgi:hypothetical protein
MIMKDGMQDHIVLADIKPTNLSKPALWIGFFLLSIISAMMVFILISIALSYHGENYPKQYHLPMLLSPLLLLTPFFLRISANSNLIKKRRFLNSVIHALVFLMGAVLIAGFGLLLMPMFGDGDWFIFGIPFLLGWACLLSVNFKLFRKASKPK